MTTFFVAGTPQTQGSKRVMMTRHADLARRRPVLVDDKRDELWSWRGAVAAEARRNLDEAYVGAVAVRAFFLLYKPPSRPRRDVHPIGERSGDVDKLLRAVLDALTGIAFHTDAAVVRATVEKRWAEPAEQTGAWIEVAPT